MGPLSAKLRIVSLVLALTIISLGDLYGADWKLLSKSGLGSFYYDRDSLEHPRNGIVRVWVTVHPSEKAISGIQELFGDKFEELSYWLELFEINCKKGNIRVLTQHCYASNGTYIGSFFYKFPTPWQEVVPLNVLGTQLLQGLCK